MPPMTPLSPIVIPATASKTADALWMTNLIIQAPSATSPVKVIVKICPFVSSTGEVLTDLEKSFVLNDVLTLAQTQPSLAACMAALLAEINKQALAKNLF